MRMTLQRIMGELPVELTSITLFYMIDVNSIGCVLMILGRYKMNVLIINIL